MEDEKSQLGSQYTKNNSIRAGVHRSSTTTQSRSLKSQCFIKSDKGVCIIGDCRKEVTNGTAAFKLIPVIDGFPMLLLDQPRAALRAFDATRGRATIGSRDSTVNMKFVLTLRFCRTGVAKV